MLLEQEENEMTDKLVIYIEPTRQDALNKFREKQQILSNQIDRASRGDLQIESGGITFRFVSQTNLDSLHGLSPTHVMVDRHCELRVDEHRFLDSLIRKKHE